MRQGMALLETLRLKKALLFLVVLSAVAAIIFMCGLALYAFPNSDDYCRMAWERDAGRPAHIAALIITRDDYVQGNPRWASMFGTLRLW